MKNNNNFIIFRFVMSKNVRISNQLWSRNDTGSRVFALHTPDSSFVLMLLSNRVRKNHETLRIVLR